nr:hypothetical protein Iba_chr06aCG13360 [Ipomoea batatas]
MASKLQLNLRTINREKINEISGKEITTTTKDKITGGSIPQTSDPSKYSLDPSTLLLKTMSNTSTNNEEDDIPNSLTKCTAKRRINFNIVTDNESTTQSSFPKENPPDVHAAKAKEQ